MSGANSIIGRAIVLYEGEDDFDKIERYGSKYRGPIYREGMGHPIGVCVVGLAKAPSTLPKVYPYKYNPTQKSSISDAQRYYMKHYGGAYKPALLLKKEEEKRREEAAKEREEAARRKPVQAQRRPQYYGYAAPQKYDAPYAAGPYQVEKQDNPWGLFESALGGW